MSSERIRELLAELSKELHATPDFDPETRKLLEQLDTELHAVTADAPTSALDRAKQLESRFAAEHPVAERIARELVDLLAKMGI